MTRSFPSAFVAAAALFLAPPANLPAAVVVLANATEGPVRFTFSTSKQQPAAHELAPGESRPFVCGKHADVKYARDGKPADLRLDAYGAYVFAAKKGASELIGIDLAGKPIPLDDVPDDAPAAATTLTVPVKLFVDDADRRARRVWEAAVRKRLEQANGVMAAHCPVTFEGAKVGEWVSDAGDDLPALLAGFEAIKLDSVRVAIGFTSRLEKMAPEPPFAAGRAALQSHVVIREAVPQSEPERLEFLVQQLGKYLGAVASPDPDSVMRVKLGDGKAAHAKFRIGFDPLNTLVMNIWIEELRAGKLAKPADLRRPARARLGRVYSTLASSLPDQPLPEEYIALAEGAVGEANAPLPGVARRPADAPGERSETTKPAPASDRLEAGRSAKQDAVRKVVRAIVRRAEQNAAAATKARGDELTSLLIRAAADAARFEDQELRPAAFAIGLGLALDDSEILRKNPLTEGFCKAVESDSDRKARLAVLGLPTVRHRRDLCQHFVVSAALTELVGVRQAELAGLLKEQLDMATPSGFSFTDLCADLSGVAFARVVRKDPDLLEQLWRKAEVADFVPKIDGLRDGLTEERFKQDFGSVEDERFTRAMDELRGRVRALPVYAALK
jgi:hypothetical protein